MFGKSGRVLLVAIVATSATIAYIVFRSKKARTIDIEREIEGQFSGFFQAVPDAVVIVTEDGRIATANAQTEALFGYSHRELQGREIETLVPESLRDRHVQERLGFQRHPRVRPMALGRDLCGRRKDGSVFSAEISLSPMKLPESGSFVIAIVRDVTERKRLLAEVERRRAETRKAQELAVLQNNILSNLSHELQTPLSLIMGDTELLQDRFPDEPLLKNLEDGARRLSDHITRLLDYTVLLGPAASLYKTEVCLREVVATAKEHVQPALDAKELVLDQNLDPSVPSLYADSRRITQMVEALLDNACKFTPPKGRISINVRPEDGLVRIGVQDSGPGIPLEFQSTIWQPFGQVKASASERTGGLGLGLAVTKRLAELHGGSVSLESEPDHGSCFSVILPMS